MKVKTESKTIPSCCFTRSQTELRKEDYAPLNPVNKSSFKYFCRNLVGAALSSCARLTVQCRVLIAQSGNDKQRGGSWCWLS